MALNKKSPFNASRDFSEKDAFNQMQRYRLMQICVVTTIGLFISLFVARGITSIILGSGLTSLIVALGFAYKHKTIVSAYILLGSMSAMLFSLGLTGAGLFDLAILGYPGLIIFAAVLGGGRLFLSVLLLVIGQCVLLAWLTLNAVVIPHTPRLSWPHLVFVLVIFVVIGFSVYILVRDIKSLMQSLQKENSKVQQNRAEIQHLAHHDTLTNLPNRLYGEALFTQLLNFCEKKNQKLALLFLDLDNFKPVNDALGHSAGDKLLEELTLRLSKLLTNDQHLIRFGGDEFLLIVPVTNGRQELNQIVERLIKACAVEFEIEQSQVAISASVGIACAPADGTDFKQLCRKADIAMYEAKQDGRNTYHYYDQQLDKATDEKFRLLQLLRKALITEQFELYYQPMINLTTGEATTIEALLRWPQADGSMIGPEQFIPLAESSGLINELGRWVISQACTYCAQQRQLGHSTLRVAVNISVIQFKDGLLQESVEKALTEANLPANALELELTESLLINNTNQFQTQLNGLNSLGVKIAIDDFGTGYSNLGYIRNFNASILKIDRSFITSLCAEKQDEPLVQAMISMASTLGLQIVAEGVEDEATLNKLISLGCQIGQGYYWSKPIPGPELATWLTNRSQ